MQQLLDKWERLRTSEYLRPDEKLMLNHCISDLKRFTDHSVDVNEMVGKQQTALDYYSKQIGKLTADLVTGRITGKQFVMLQIKLLEQAKEMEKDQIMEFAQLYAVIHCMGDITKNADEYYNETFGGGNK
jgi:hypothetical protein